MNTRTLSDSTRSLITAYDSFTLGGAKIRIPYFNNKKTGIRRGLPAQLGKGSPEEITQEILIHLKTTRDKVPTLTPDALTQLMVNESIGIDCSGYAFYILDTESRARKLGALDRHLKFPLVRNIFMRFIARLYPASNTDVATLAHSSNSSEIKIDDVTPGDIITILNSSQHSQGDRNHILIIESVDYQNFKPITIHYTHSIAWPSDGTFNHGVRHGRIDILNSTQSLIEQRWTEIHENIQENTVNYTHEKAKSGTTTLRRLNWF